jgi:hypothetical protein
MFADPQKINTQAVGQRALIDQIAQHLILRQQFAVSAQGHIAKGIKAKGKCHRMPHLQKADAKLILQGPRRNAGGCAPAAGLCAQTGQGRSGVRP